MSTPRLPFQFRLGSGYSLQTRTAALALAAAMRTRPIRLYAGVAAIYRKASWLSFGPGKLDGIGPTAPVVTY